MNTWAERDDSDAGDADDEDDDDDEDADDDVDDEDDDADDADDDADALWSSPYECRKKRDQKHKKRRRPVLYIPLHLHHRSDHDTPCLRSGTKNRHHSHPCAHRRPEAPCSR